MGRLHLLRVSTFRYHQVRPPHTFSAAPNLIICTKMGGQNPTIHTAVSSMKKLEASFDTLGHHGHRRPQIWEPLQCLCSRTASPIPPQLELCPAEISLLSTNPAATQVTTTYLRPTQATPSLYRNFRTALADLFALPRDMTSQPSLIGPKRAASISPAMTLMYRPVLPHAISQGIPLSKESVISALQLRWTQLAEAILG